MAKVTCPRGIEFESQKAMYEHYGLKKGAVDYRRRQGWSLAQILNIDPSPPSSLCVSMVCPNGVTFESQRAMCNYYGVPQSIYHTRLKKGWTERQALGIDPPPRGVTCPNGMEFRSITQMCKHYNVSQGNYHTCVNKYGWTERQALGIDPKPRSVKCPRGRLFDSQIHMCEYYGVSQTKYGYRIRNGWTVAQALGIDPPPQNIRVTDPNGQGFYSIIDMCSHHGVTSDLYSSRLKTGWTQRQALGIDPSPNGLGKKFVDSTAQSWSEKLSILQKENSIKDIQFYLVQDKETLKNYVLTEEQIKTYPLCIQKFTKIKD